MALPEQLQPCRVRLLGEVVQCPSPGLAVRVTGELEHIEAPRQRALLRDLSGRLWVDVSMIDVSLFGEGDLVQVLGELQQPDSELAMGMDGAPLAAALLRARFVRSVGGLDLRIYEQCLQVRRHFEAQHCPELPLPMQLH
mmetsp:Transcript_92185/g.298476  ORF Transcript_92185/g.298476 Transcript_92185/m.298476 type:complete len:140 (+) Transcript_92185:84-503(+)